MTKRTHQWPADWGLWDEFTQYRRPHPMRVEFRRSVPAALLLGLLLAMATLDVAFIGLVLPRQDAGTSLSLAVSAVAVFLLGRGVVIDGTHQVVRRWWGWLSRPILSTPIPFSAIEGLEIRKRWAPRHPTLTSAGTFTIPSICYERVAARSWSSAARGFPRHGSSQTSSRSSCRSPSPTTRANRWMWTKRSIEETGTLS